MKANEALTRLAIGLVLAMSPWFSASAVIPQLRAIWDLSDGPAAWLTIAVQLGFVAGALLSAITNLTDIVVPQKIIALSVIGAGLANLGLLSATGASTAIPLRAATGFFLAGVYPPAFKLMATWFRKRRGMALGVLAGAIALGSAMPHLINGLGGLDWRIVVYVTSALTVLGGVIAATVPTGPFPFARGAFDPRQFRRVFANRGVLLASVGYFGHMWELFAMWAWFIVFFSSVAGEGTGAAFATFFVIGIGALGCWLGGVLGDRWGRTPTTMVSLAASGTCALVIGLLADAPRPLLLAVGLVWGFTVIPDSAQYSTMVTELADPAYVGTALTLQLALGFLLTVVTIWLVPLLENGLTWRWAFAFLAPGPAIGIWAMARLRASEHALEIAGGRG